jgi:hypothetical protein
MLGHGHQETCQESRGKEAGEEIQEVTTVAA